MEWEVVGIQRSKTLVLNEGRAGQLPRTEPEQGVDRRVGPFSFQRMTPSDFRRWTHCCSILRRRLSSVQPHSSTATYSTQTPSHSAGEQAGGAAGSSVGVWAQSTRGGSEGVVGGAERVAHAVRKRLSSRASARTVTVDIAYGLDGLGLLVSGVPRSIAGLL